MISSGNCKVPGSNCFLDRKRIKSTANIHIDHYQRGGALNETIRLMAEIDRVIETHVGWPGAFQASAGEFAK
ncbi:MAG: hypothetical protein A2W28_07820 [Gammaproteobacteria bacterium RBG_16_51_14]|nr:MAG: hypothetical protein A2W28_07820 [Gammaproteobacteria bacterium RBG_16_51_14]